MIAPRLTFQYQFSVQCDAGPAAGVICSPGADSPVTFPRRCWTGPGSGQTFFGEEYGLVGLKPRFELCGGWLTLLPTDGWTQSFPIRWFSDVTRPQALDSAARVAAFKNFMEKALRRRNLTRDLASYAVFVGEALGEVFRIGDEFRFSRDGGGDFRYSVIRNSEAVFSAGSVCRVDDGGPVAICQEYDSYPNPNAKALKMKFSAMRVEESIPVNRPYVSVRVKTQTFHLLDGQEVHSDPYYVFLARSNRNVPPFAFEFAPRAVHSVGFVAAPGKELIIDAARRLAEPVTRTL